MAKTSIRADDLIQLRHLARSLALGGRTPVRSVIAGTHLSRFRGRGVDYLESRNYEIGDDIRNLDWRVTARTGRPHTKIFQEERERPVIVLLDLGASMFFGTRKRLKSVLGAELAALIGWAATRRGDRIGGLVFHGPVHHEVRPRGGRRGSMYLLRIIEQGFRQASRDPSAAPEGMPAALEKLRRVCRPGSLVLLISDFLGLDAGCGRHLSLLRQHCDVMAFQVRDAVERAVPPEGVYPVSDGQQQGVLDLRGPDARRDYFDRVVRAGDAAAEQLAGFGIRVVSLRPDDEPGTVLAQVFGQSRGRRL